MEYTIEKQFCAIRKDIEDSITELLRDASHTSKRLATQGISYGFTYQAPSASLRNTVQLAIDLDIKTSKIPNIRMVTLCTFFYRSPLHHEKWAFQV